MKIEIKTILNLRQHKTRKETNVRKRLIDSQFSKNTRSENLINFG